MTVPLDMSPAARQLAEDIVGIMMAVVPILFLLFLIYSVFFRSDE